MLMRMSDKAELTIRGIYFEHDHRGAVESHGGVPGVELTVGDCRIFLNYKEASIIAKTIERLGTSGRNSVTVCGSTPAS